MATTGPLPASGISIAALVAGVCFILAASSGWAEPAVDQAVYWWQDEIRSAGFELSTARTGKVAEWPKMTVPAGAATMPVPAMAVGAKITVDGRLDEEAWERATSFPVGPVFDEWARGPVMLWVSACRDEKNVYLAIRSPRVLDGLGALTPAGELFSVGKKTYRVGPGGGLPKESVGRDGEGQVIELALPAGAVTISFPVEAVRRADGKLPAELSGLGLQLLATPGASRDYREPWLWLSPVIVKLVPAKTAVRLSCSIDKSLDARLQCQVGEPGQPPRTSELKLPRQGHFAVRPYTWKTEAEGQTFSSEGFLHVEPIQEILNATREITARSVRMGSQESTSGPKPEEIAALEAEIKNASPADRAAWRNLYCRARRLRARAHLSMLDAPLLFVKQHPYFAAHIYDDYITWHPGGGIYRVENPWAAPGDREVRAVVDPKTKETLGEGVYRDPEISWDGRRMVFAFKPDEHASTGIYEINVDGTGLRQLTFPCDCEVLKETKRIGEGHHDITPAYLPDGRIVFTSTRQDALVPCFNSGVDTLHVMDADGGNIRGLSVNNVTEFDPAVMPDGRIVYGRWEYVDKTALYMQSLWTMLPDGRMEEALFANNLPKPTAVLDARPVPNTNLVVASLTPHNGQAVGGVGMIDTGMGKNDLKAVFNFTPEYAVEMDQGLRTGPCDPWALSRDDVLMSNNALAAHGIIELVDRRGNRELVHADGAISCFAPMLIKARKTPPVVEPQIDEESDTGRFVLVDVYQGLEGVERGSIKRLRVVEETARISGIPAGGRWWNQAFLVSWQGAYIIKNILGTVPVHEDGSAHFEVPSGRAVYFEALDEEGREIQRMRTFVAAVPGSTRSCVGCHENKKTTTASPGDPPLAMLKPPARIEPESWGSGYVDYPTMVQPILDKHCVSCHGGEKGFAAGMDFSGGWTWAFNIGYETLIKHRMLGFLNCHNSSVHTSEILKPRTIGSGASPLAEILIEKHPELSRAERDLILAWMDTNSNYFGTWDYSPYATCDAILATKAPLSAVMNAAGCVECHAPGFIGADWVNLQTPEFSRILRAPMAKSEGGLGVEMCRARKAPNGYPLVNQSVQPPDVVRPSIEPEWDPGGEPVVAFASSDNPHYRAMLQIIRHAQGEALSRPRVDMPGAEIEPGRCRLQGPMGVPDSSPVISAGLRSDYALELSWPRTAATIGLEYEIHRGRTAEFTPTPETLIGLTTAGRYVDLRPPVGLLHYALVVVSRTERSKPSRTSHEMLQPPLPPAPLDLRAVSLPGEIALSWNRPALAGIRFNVFRREGPSAEAVAVNPEPLEQLNHTDRDVRPGVNYVYTVRTLDRREQLSEPSNPADATPLPEIREPVFSTDFGKGPVATLLDGKTVQGKLQGGAKVVDGRLSLESSGFVSFGHLPQFDLGKSLSVEVWVRIDQEGQMPVIAAAGGFNSAGWFIQRYGGGWRWHLAPVSCDGGRPVVGRPTQIVGTFDGKKASLYQDGKLVREVDCYPNYAAWPGPLVIGQYSQQGPQYQVHGAIGGLKILHRALGAEEVAEKFAAGP